MLDSEFIHQVNDLQIETDNKLIEDIASGNYSLENVLYLFDRAEKAYKEAQNITLAVDYQLHNEYHYAARAMATILRTPDESNQNCILAKHHLLTSTLHILNDSLDLMIGVLEEEIETLNNLCFTKSIIDCYPEFSEKYNVVKEIKRVISTSRQERGVERIKLYMELLRENKISFLADFIETLQKEVKASLISSRRKEIFSSIGWLTLLIVGIGSSIVALLK